MLEHFYIAIRFGCLLEFDLGKGYFKSNVFILGLKSDTGLVKICVTIMTTKHELCHYMNAA